MEAETPKGPATTRDIRLELNNGDHKVELHLADRGGDVHVAVRTPDSHLASELRENLPALSSRLEQTGYHPEGWQSSATVHGEGRGEAERFAGGTSHPNGPAGQDAREQEGHPDRRPPENLEEQPHRKKQGKEFAWFMSSLR